MKHTQTYTIKGMHCASCAGNIEKALKKSKGVDAAEVNYGTEGAKITFDPSKTSPIILSEKIEKLGYSMIVPEVDDTSQVAEQSGWSQAKNEKLAEIAAMKHKLLTVIPLAVFSIAMMSWEMLVHFHLVHEIPKMWNEFFHHLMPVFATYTLFVVGQPYLQGMLRFFRNGNANMDTLVGIGTSVSFLYSFIISAFKETLRPWINVDHSYYDVTIVVIAFISLGKYLETRSKLKTGDAIEKLLNLQAKTALVLRDGKEVEIPIQQVVLGDLIVVKPSGKIPVDGIITEGNSYVDEAMITGEPMPVEKNVGASVVAGSLNTSGSFTFQATKVGADTMLATIIKLVAEAQGSRAPIQALADQISRVFVPIVLVLSVISLALWLTVGTHFLGFSQALSYGLVSFVGILVIACPCALGLATPTAIIVGVGKGAREGILIKDAGTLEKLHQVDTVVVDKTGTITKGKPELVAIKNFSDQSDDALLAILATLEKKSEHPLAHAISSYADEHHISLLALDHFEAIQGKGVKGVIAGTEYFAGNGKLMADLGISLDFSSIEKETAEGNTPMMLATSEKILSIILVADAIKPEAKNAIAQLHQLGIKVVMLTGDHKNTAHHIAGQVGIDEVFAEVLPAEKQSKIKELQAQGRIVAMAGDGVNDAPALAQADVGIAMATGTDVAIESAGITLLHGDLNKLVKAIHLSKLTMRGIKQNLFWAFFYNIIGIPLAGGLFYPLFGWLLNPIFAGLAMAFSSVFVVGNSLRLKASKL